MHLDILICFLLCRWLLVQIDTKFEGVSTFLSQDVIPEQLSSSFFMTVVSRPASKHLDSSTRSLHSCMFFMPWWPLELWFRMSKLISSFRLWLTKSSCSAFIFSHFWMCEMLIVCHSLCRVKWFPTQKLFPLELRL